MGSALLLNEKSVITRADVIASGMLTHKETKKPGAGAGFFKIYG